MTPLIELATRVRKSIPALWLRPFFPPETRFVDPLATITGGETITKLRLFRRAFSFPYHHPFAFASILALASPSLPTTVRSIKSDRVHK